MLLTHCFQISTVAMAAAVPTFSWTYKAGQQQQPHPICPQGHSHNCYQGHLDTRLTLQRFMDLQLKSAFECQLFKVTERDRELWQCLGLLYLCTWAYRPSFISALLSQVHVDVQQEERWRELTLIHCDKNENTSLWVSLQLRRFVESSAEKHDVTFSVESCAARMRSCLWYRLPAHWSPLWSQEDVLYEYKDGQAQIEQRTPKQETFSHHSTDRTAFSSALLPSMINDW